MRKIVRFIPARFNMSLLCVICVCFAIAGPSQGAIPVELMDTNLETRNVQLVALRDGQLAYFDASGELQRISTDSLVRITFTHKTNPYRDLEDPNSTWDHLQPQSLARQIEQLHQTLHPRDRATPTRGKLVLTDGQVLMGTPAKNHLSADARHAQQYQRELEHLRQLQNELPADAHAQLHEQLERMSIARERRLAQEPDANTSGLHWHHDLLPGDPVIPIEWIHRIDLSDEAARDINAFKSTDVDDRVTLINEDTMHGLVMAFEQDHLALASPETGQVMQIPLANVQALLFSHALTRPEANEQRVQLADSSNLLLSELTTKQTNDDAWVLESASRLSWHGSAAETDRITIPMDEVKRIDLLTSGYRYVPLTSQPYEIVTGADPFGIRVALSQDKLDLLVPGPIHLRWHFPQNNIERITGRVMLDPPGNHPAIIERFASVRLQLRIGHETYEETLNAEKRGVDVDIMGGGQTMELILEPGAFGPMLDRVRLKDVHLLLHEK